MRIGEGVPVDLRVAAGAPHDIGIEADHRIAAARAPPSTDSSRKTRPCRPAESFRKAETGVSRSATSRVASSAGAPEVVESRLKMEAGVIMLLLLIRRRA